MNKNLWIWANAYQLTDNKNSIRKENQKIPITTHNQHKFNYKEKQNVQSNNSGREWNSANRTKINNQREEQLIMNENISLIR